MARPIPLPRDFFWERIEEGLGGCWNWTGAIDGGGYGVCQVFGREGPKFMAHRLAWHLFVGPVPDETLDHLCRNRRCVNPMHLEPVSNVENMRRGFSPPARNARKKFCPQGHEYTAENTMGNGTGRKCKTCHRERERARRVPARRRTHCRQGHEYTVENTRLHNGKRYCRACARAKTARHRAKQAAS